MNSGSDDNKIGIKDSPLQTFVEFLAERKAEGFYGDCHIYWQGGDVIRMEAMKESKMFGK